MRLISVLLAALLVACVAAPPRPLPTGPDWAKGTAVRVVHQLPWGPEIKGYVEEDLRSAGFQVVGNDGKGELVVTIESYDGSNLHVAIERDGKPLDRLEFNVDRLSCSVMTLSFLREPDPEDCSGRCIN